VPAAISNCAKRLPHCRQNFRLQALRIGGFVSFTLAIIFLFVGKIALARYVVLHHYSIRETVIGGGMAAIVVGVIGLAFDLQVGLALGVQDYLLLYAPGGTGLKSDVRMLLSGWDAAAGAVRDAEGRSRVSLWISYPRSFLGSVRHPWSIGFCRCCWLA
jgi:hypothetical protein